MKSILKASALVAVALAGSAALASGYEKSIVLGGRSAGVAGIATPYIQGADALYFNPAGLAGDKVGNSLSFNISPTMPQFKGPINSNNEEATTESKTLFPVSLIYGNTFNEQWGMGVGVFVSGGANASYKDLTYGNNAAGYRPEVKTDLQIIEASAGVGYKATENLKLGLAWRVVMAQADFSFVQRATGSPTFVSANAKLTGLKDTQALAFRAGAQYKVSESTDLALTFRSEVNFEAKGKAQVTTFSAANGAVVGAGAEQDATARTTFPMAITLGGLHKLNEDWNLMGEYVWTQYSRIGEIVVDSTAFATTGNQSRLKTEWADQHNVRVAAEYNTPWPVRFGYVWTSTVTNTDYARASFAPPAPAHTLTLGTGKAFSVGEGAESNMRFDTGFEYTFSSADGGASQATAGNGAPSATYDANARNGKYSVTAYALHLGVSYMF